MLERTDAITNAVLEPFTFAVAYRTVLGNILFRNFKIFLKDPFKRLLFNDKNILKSTVQKYTQQNHQYLTQAPLRFSWLSTS